MPGKDEKKEPEQKQKQEQEQFNEFYFSMMKDADRFIKDAKTGLGDFDDPKVNELWKQSSLQNIAKAIAYGQIAMKYGTGPEPDSKTKAQLKEKVAKRAEKIQKSDSFQAAFTGISNSDIRKLITNPKKGENYGEAVPYDEFVARFNYRQETPQGRMGKLVYQLEHSTQKSIFGKIKSVFTGNSQQYKNALGAMKALSEGKVRSSETMNAAKKAIKDYILARGNKVRDHQYGRDRFDAFMKGLGEIMEPQEFVDLCTDVNSKRIDNGEQTFDPLDYLPTEEKKAAFEKAEREARARYRATDRAADIAAWKEQKAQREQNQNEREKQNKQAELQAKAEKEAQQRERELKNKPQQLKNDVIRINRDEETKKTKDSHDLTLTQRNQIVLDQLRNHADEYLNYGRSREREAINERLIHHPAFRLAAEDIIYDKGLDKIFKIPETQFENMEPDTLKKLTGQVQELQKLDRYRHPGMTIDDVWLPEVKEQQKTGPQAGGDMVL